MGIRYAMATAALMLLTACMPSLPWQGKAAPDAVSSPITGGQIETTRLASPSQPAPATTAQAAPATAAVAAAPASGATAPPPPRPGAEPAAEVAAPTTPVPPVAKSPAQLACEKRNGRWSKVGSGNACVTMTRDSGKSCKRKSDCQGQCLARSMTCAPAEPMFGCNEVVENSGVRVRLCID